MLLISKGKCACRMTEVKVVSDIYGSRNIAIVLMKILQYAAQVIGN